MCVYIYIYIYIYKIYTYVHIHTYIHTYTHICIYTHTYKHTNIHVDAHAQAIALPNIYFPMQTVCPMSALRTLTPSALSDTHIHTESNGTHHRTSDSLYRHCFYFTLIQNRHTWRNTNRCTHTIYLWSKIPPEQTQNNSRHRELSRQPETAGRVGYKAEWSESNSNKSKLILQLHTRSHTHTHTYIHTHRHTYSVHVCAETWTCMPIQ